MENKEPELKEEERQKCEIWTRIMGYFRPLSVFNPGKKSEFRERRYFSEEKALTPAEKDAASRAKEPQRRFPPLLPCPGIQQNFHLRRFFVLTLYLFCVDFMFENDNLSQTDNNKHAGSRHCPHLNRHSDKKASVSLRRGWPFSRCLKTPPHI